MVKINPYRPETIEVLQIGLKKLYEIIIQKQNERTQNLPETVNPELITKEFERDLTLVGITLKAIHDDSVFGVEIPELGFDIIRSGLLLYKDDLIEATNISNTKELQSEINKVNRFLDFPAIKNVETTFYDKYQKKKKEKNGEITTDELIEVLERINTISKQKLKTPLFKNNAKSIKDLKNKCENEPEFIFEIANIANLIGEIHQDEIQKIISIDGVSGSINILEKLFFEKNKNYNKKPFKTLRKLTKLRSTKMPIHSGEHEAIPILEELGITHPVDFQSAGKIIYKKYVESMKEILDIIQQSS